MEPAFIQHDLGGYVADYRKTADTLASAGKPVVIDGDCFSACTLIATDPRLDVCYTPRAHLHFHAPNVGSLSYSDKWQKKIDRMGGLPPFASGQWLTLDRFDLRGLLRPCNRHDLKGYAR